MRGHAQGISRPQKGGIELNLELKWRKPPRQNKAGRAEQRGNAEHCQNQDREDRCVSFQASPFAAICYGMRVIKYNLEPLPRPYAPALQRKLHCTAGRALSGPWASGLQSSIFLSDSQRRTSLLCMPGGTS